MSASYLASARKEFEQYKTLAEKTIAQLPDEALDWQYNDESNSIVIIVKHMVGNMLSRWTDMLGSDGEKEWRDRDGEFMNEKLERGALMAYWQKGWQQVFETLDTIAEEDLERTIYIRSEPHTVTRAINRQIAHYAYHAGQIVYIGKMLMNEQWRSLSIPRNASADFNVQMKAKQGH